MNERYERAKVTSSPLLPPVATLQRGTDVMHDGHITWEDVRELDVTVNGDKVSVQIFTWHLDHTK